MSAQAALPLVPSSSLVLHSGHLAHCGFVSPLSSRHRLAATWPTSSTPKLLRAHHPPPQLRRRHRVSSVDCPRMRSCWCFKGTAQHSAQHSGARGCVQLVLSSLTDSTLLALRSCALNLLPSLPPSTHAALCCVCRAWYHCSTYPDACATLLSRRVRYWMEWMMDQPANKQTSASARASRRAQHGGHGFTVDSL